MPTDPTTTPTTPAAARVTIRRATPANAADVVAMVKAIADLEDQATRVDAQRFYRRLDAALRPKIVAAWPPSVYADGPPATDPAANPAANPAKSPVRTRPPPRRISLTPAPPNRRPQ